MRALSLFFFPLVAFASPSLPAPAAPLDAFVDAVGQRNAIAYQVAAFKYPIGKPVEDPVREAQVLEAKRAAALQQGLDADAVVHFYRQAIEANKLIQHMLFHRFTLGETPALAPPLDQVREQIDRVDAQILSRWPTVQAQRDSPTCPRDVAQAMDRMAQPTIDQIALVRAMIGFCRDTSSREAARPGAPNT